MEKPFSPSCDRNKDPILDVLRDVFAHTSAVLELGSGTGQHAVYLAEHLKHLRWITSDLAEHQSGIQAWIDAAGLANIEGPNVIDVGSATWNVTAVDAVFTANTLHIISWNLVVRLIAQVGKLLPSGGNFCVYGPFNYEGQFTSASNAQFDIWLKNRDTLSGIRHYEDIVAQCLQAELNLVRDYAMPANNRILHFRKQ